MGASGSPPLSENQVTALCFVFIALGSAFTPRDTHITPCSDHWSVGTLSTWRTDVSDIFWKSSVVSWNGAACWFL